MPANDSWLHNKWKVTHIEEIRACGVSDWLECCVHSHCHASSPFSVHLHLRIITFCPDLRAELQLDWLKGTRGGVKRVLFLDTQQPQRTGLLTLGHNRPRACRSYTIYLKVSERHTNTNPTLWALHNVGYLTEESAPNCSVHDLNSLLLCQEDDEFRDKLTPISLALNYSLAPPSHGQDLPPVLNHYSSTLLQEHVSIYCMYNIRSVLYI